MAGVPAAAVRPEARDECTVRVVRPSAECPRLLALRSLRSEEISCWRGAELTEDGGRSPPAPEQSARSSSLLHRGQPSTLQSFFCRQKWHEIPTTWL